MLAAQYHAAAACAINYTRGAAYVHQGAAQSCGVTHAPIGSTAARCLPGFCASLTRIFTLLLAE